MNRTVLAIQAVREASRLRAAYEINPTEGVCPFDLGKKIGISMNLVSIPTLEGMYSPEPSLAIVIGSDRPLGRKRYTCGHELGHHIFKHGYKIDELNESNTDSFSPDEYIAQRFSAALLMPKLAINSAFTIRNWKIQTATAEQFFVVAQELGVGYQSLLTNLEINTNQLLRSQVNIFKKKKLKDLRKKIAGFDVNNDVFHLNDGCARPILDIEVGDILIVPVGTKINGTCIQFASTPKDHYEGVQQGVGEIEFTTGKTCQVRVSKRNFVGLAHYRYLEEVDDE